MQDQWGTYTVTLRSLVHVYLSTSSYWLSHYPSPNWRPKLRRASPPVLSMYVTLNITLGWRKVNKCRFGSGKWFFSCMFSEFLSLLSLVNPQQRCTPAEKSVINKIWLVLLIFDWPIIMIRPGGLLLVVPTYLQFPVQFYGWGLEKSKQLNLEVTNIFAESHTEHQWGCSSLPISPHYVYYVFNLLLGFRARRSLRWEYLDHGQSEPAPTKCTTMDGWCMDRTFFFHWVPIAEGSILSVCKRF
jgi:hypothetical protein